MNSWYKYINDYGTIESISTTKTEKNKNLETMWTNHTSTKSWKNSLIYMISKIKKVSWYTFRVGIAIGYMIGFDCF